MKPQILYFSDEDETWTKELLKRPVEKKIKLTPDQEKIEALEKKLLKASSSYQFLFDDFHELEKQNRSNQRKAAEANQFRDALIRTEETLKKESEARIKIQDELTEFQSKIDAAVERALSAELDATQEVEKARIRNGILKQLRGYFDWRQRYPEKKSSHVLEGKDIAQILLLITNALDPTIIKKKKR